MPNYDMKCRVCGLTFEVSRPMARADEPAPCPDGHEDTVRLLSAVAVTGRASRPAVRAPRCGAGPAAGGCCGGGSCASP